MQITDSRRTWFNLKKETEREQRGGGADHSNCCLKIIPNSQWKMEPVEGERRDRLSVRHSHEGTRGLPEEIMLSKHRILLLRTCVRVHEELLLFTPAFFLSLFPFFFFKAPATHTQNANITIALLCSGACLKVKGDPSPHHSHQLLLPSRL